MKGVTILIFLLSIAAVCVSQIHLTGKVIPWKELDHLDSLNIRIQSTEKDIFDSTYSVNEIQRPGKFPKTLFDLELNTPTKELLFSVKYKYHNKDTAWNTYPTYSHPKTIMAPVNYRAQRIELEIHFQKYHNENSNYITLETIDKLIIKKIYKLPDGIKLVRNWDPKTSNAPMYLIENESPFKLYGQSGDGKFEGELFENTNGKTEQVYTGGYNLDSESSKPLHRDDVAISYIRDHREPDNKFKIANPGSYIYKVYLGFLPYESFAHGGDFPFYSVQKKQWDNMYWDNRIYEYFELIDQFEIK